MSENASEEDEGMNRSQREGRHDLMMKDSESEEVEETVKLIIKGMMVKFSM